jgi:hypothetical protein
VLKECWSIYAIDGNNKDKNITWFYGMAALKLAKECNEALIKLYYYWKTSENNKAMIEHNEQIVSIMQQPLNISMKDCNR